MLDAVAPTKANYADPCVALQEARVAADLWPRCRALRKPRAINALPHMTHS